MSTFNEGDVLDLSELNSNVEDRPLDLVADQPAIGLDKATRRAAKADYGLGELSPGHESLQYSIANGFEAVARDYSGTYDREGYSISDVSELHHW